MKTLLITGATGYLGRHVVENLGKAGMRLICCTRRGHTTINSKNVRYIKGDITNERYIESILSANKIDCVIHLAAEIEFDHDRKKLRNMVLTNILGTYNVISCMIEHNVRNLIFVSSMSVIGVPRYLPVDEAHPSEPFNLYGITKKHAEDLVEYFSGKSGIVSYILRFPGLFDEERTDGALYTFIKNSLANEELKIALNQPSVWSFLHVDDAVLSIERSIKTIEGAKGCNVINVGYKQAVEIKDLARRIITLTKSRSKVSVEGRMPSYKFCFDNKKASREIGIRLPTLDSRIKDFIRAVRRA